MRHVIAAVIFLMCGVALVGCKSKSESEKAIPGAETNVSESNIAEPNASLPVAYPTISDTFEIHGTIVRKNIEGGFYAIDADDGRKYNPTYLSESFRKDGQKVKVTARLRMDAMSIHMYGAIIEVIEIAEN